MEGSAVIGLIFQYLSEHNYQQTLESLEKESGRQYKPVMNNKDGELQEILDEHAAKKRFEDQAAVSVADLFQSGNGRHANELWTSLDYLTEGHNVLVVRLADNGNLAVGGAKALIITAQIATPLVPNSPPHSVLSTTHHLCKGGVLALDHHPLRRNILLCSSMDRSSFIVDLDEEDEPLIQKFNDHKKKNSNSELHERVDRMEFKGEVDRGISHFTGRLQEVQQINMNAMGDDYVSFTALHCSFSPDEKFILVSTDQDRLILYSRTAGKLVTSFYGAVNDEFSQPRHCWDPSGQYIYGTSQDKSICVWEIRSQKIVQRLQGHSGMVYFGVCESIV